MQKVHDKIEKKMIDQKYRELKEVVEDMQQDRSFYIWSLSRKYDNQLKEGLQDYKLQQKKISVAKARELERLLSIKCRVVDGKND
jgi:hypothetical protein